MRPSSIAWWNRDHFNFPVDSGDHAPGINCSWTRDGWGRRRGESRCQRLRSDAAAARSAGNRMEVSTSSVPAATPDHPENVHTHTIDPRGEYFIRGFGNFSLEFRRHSPSSGHDDAPKNTGQNVWKRKLEWTVPPPPPPLHGENRLGEGGTCGRQYGTVYAYGDGGRGRETSRRETLTWFTLASVRSAGKFENSFVQPFGPPYGR